jgi:hypothetical protein
MAQVSTITTQNCDHMRHARAERHQRSQQGDSIATAQVLVRTSIQNREHMRHARAEAHQRSQQGDSIATAQVVRTSMQHREHMRHVRAERYQRSQEGDAVATTQVTTVTTQNRAHMRHARQTVPSTHSIGYSQRPLPARHVLGTCTNECQACSALHFRQEKSKRGFFSDCCAQGSVALPPLEPIPNLLIELLANAKHSCPTSVHTTRP